MKYTPIAQQFYKHPRTFGFIDLRAQRYEQRFNLGPFDTAGRGFFKDQFKGLDMFFFLNGFMIPIFSIIYSIKFPIRPKPLARLSRKIENGIIRRQVSMESPNRWRSMDIEAFVDSNLLKNITKQVNCRT